MDKKTVVVNCVAGPGAGKTTCAWEMASELKKQGFSCEYVPEYAKELVWDNRLDLLDGTWDKQLAVLNEQERRINRLIGKVDFVVTDSPLILNALYMSEPEKSKAYRDMVYQKTRKHNNFYLFVNRGSSFEKEGRIHSEQQSKAIDAEVKQILKDYNIYYGSYYHSTISVAIQNCVTHLRNLSSGKDVTVGKGVNFERIRRITGYLAGTVDRWNNAKRAELADRRPHSLTETLAECKEKADAHNSSVGKKGQSRDNHEM